MGSMRRWIAVLALAVTACGSPAPTAQLSPSPSSPAPAAAVDVEGPFRLTFVLPRSTWMASEAITGQAQLALTAGDQVALSGSGGGLLGFGFAEVGGTRQMGPGWTADCRRYALAAAAPMTSAITKSGGWSEDQPDAAFYRGFFNDALVHLPAGQWDITAVASFIEGPGCGGTSHEMRATVRVTVTP